MNKNTNSDVLDKSPSTLTEDMKDFVGFLYYIAMYSKIIAEHQFITDDMKIEAIDINKKSVEILDVYINSIENEPTNQLFERKKEIYIEMNELTEILTQFENKLDRSLFFIDNKPVFTVQKKWNINFIIISKGGIA